MEEPTPRARGWTRLDSAIAAVLAVGNVLMHLPYRARHLSTWDSVLFALGMERYSVPDARPHPPGYPVYIALARLARPAFDDENSTLVALSLVMAGAAVALLYVLGRRLLPRWPALVAATLFGFSPVLAHNSVLATSYAGEALFAIAVAWAAWSARRTPGIRSAAVLGAVFLLALGFRQSLLFYLTPLVAWALLAGGWPAAGSWRPLLLRAGSFVAASLAVGLAWLVPMLAASGPRSYFAATSLQTRLVVFQDTVFNGGRAAWDDHWTRLMLYVRPEVLYVLPILAVLVLGALAAGGTRRGRRVPLAAPPLAPEGWSFLAIWLLPPLLFYLLIFNGWDKGPDGYALVLLPPLYLGYAALGAALVSRIRAAVPDGPLQRSSAILSALLLVPAVGLVGAWEAPMKEVSDHDQWTEAWQALEDEFPANDTAIVASYSWPHVKWFFPDHILWSRLAIPPGPDWDDPWVLTMQTQHREDDVSFYEAHLRGPVPTAHPIPDGVQRVVLFDFQLAGENGGERQLQPEIEVLEAVLANGWRVLYFETDPDHATIESYFLDPRG